MKTLEFGLFSANANDAEKIVSHLVGRTITSAAIVTAAEIGMSGALVLHLDNGNIATIEGEGAESDGLLCNIQRRE